ncbi:hypothetical protein R6Q57_029999 [Mikania cordata]
MYISSVIKINKGLTKQQSTSLNPKEEPRMDERREEDLVYGSIIYKLEQANENAFDNLKSKYVGWVYLKNKTGNLYKAQTNTFTLTNEEWEEFKKGHRKVGSLKTVPLPFPDHCAALFDGNSATGSLKCTSSQKTSTSEPNPDPTNDPTFEPTPDPTFQPTPVPTLKPTREATPDSNPRKRSKSSKSSSINTNDLAHDMRQALQYLIKGKEGPKVVECYEKLKLVWFDPVDLLFLAALHIIGVSTGMREAWMTLPDIPEVLSGWIVMTATSLGLIKQ